MIGELGSATVERADGCMTTVVLRPVSARAAAAGPALAILYGPARAACTGLAIPSTVEPRGTSANEGLLPMERHMLSQVASWARMFCERCLASTDPLAASLAATWPSIAASSGCTRAYVRRACAGPPAPAVMIAASVVLVCVRQAAAASSSRAHAGVVDIVTTTATAARNNNQQIRSDTLQYTLERNLTPQQVVLPQCE